jgi:CubicO group peptidase (beta-lactamase class C family)
VYDALDFLMHSFFPMIIWLNRRRFVMRSFILLAVIMFCSDLAKAEPGVEWKLADRSETQVTHVDAAVQAYARKYNPTALMVVRNDVVLATAGDVQRKVNVRSVRKSLLSALIGIAVEHGQMNTDQALAQLQVDDNTPSLTPEEGQATVRQLLMARSGVYHPANYESPDQQRARPARGSHPPGTFWYYNNWDFNALGAIYTKATGDNPFKGFERLIAQRIGMQDFSAGDGIFIGNGSSLHRAYVFDMSARDLSRFGLLYLNQGRWNDVAIVPSQWVMESTKAYSETDRTQRKYGYLWWILDPEHWGKDAILASGTGGQHIAIVPEKRLVVVQVFDLSRGTRGIRTPDFLDLVRHVATIAN